MLNFVLLLVLLFLFGFHTSRSSSSFTFNTLVAGAQAVLLNCSVCMECLLSSILLVSSLGGPGGAEGRKCLRPDSFSEKPPPTVELKVWACRMEVLVELRLRGGRDLGLAWELWSNKKAPDPRRSNPDKTLLLGPDSLEPRVLEQRRGASFFTSAGSLALCSSGRLWRSTASWGSEL